MTKMMNMIRWNRDNGSDHRPLQPGPDEDSPDRPEDMLILLVCSHCSSFSVERIESPR